MISTTRRSMSRYSKTRYLLLNIVVVHSYAGELPGNNDGTPPKFRHENLYRKRSPNNHQTHNQSSKLVSYAIEHAIS